MKNRYLIWLLAAGLTLGTAACSSRATAPEPETEPVRNLLVEDADAFLEPLLEQVREQNRLAVELEEVDPATLPEVHEIPENFSQGYETLDYMACVSANQAEALKGTKTALVGARVLAYTQPDETGKRYYHILGVQDEAGNFWKVILNNDGVEDKVVTEAYDYNTNGVAVNGTYMGISGRYPLLIADSWFTVRDGETHYADGVAASRNNIASVFRVEKAKPDSGNETTPAVKPQETTAPHESDKADETTKAPESTEGKADESESTEGKVDESESTEAEEPTASRKFVRSMEEQVAFFEEYVEFMAAYDAEDKSQAIKFIDYSSKYAAHMEDLERIGQSGLNDAEEQIYQETMQKIDEILAEVKKQDE